ncbi:MAG: efflux RND transporter permease subunit [Spirochaetota bacterium]
MNKIPLALYRRFGAWLILPFLLISVVAGVTLRGLTFDAGYGTIIPENDEYRRLERRVEEQFGRGSLVIVAVDIAGPGTDPDATPVLTQADLERVWDVTRTALAVEGTGTVVSLANLQDLVLEDETLVDRRLYDPNDPDMETLNERVMQTPLFRKLFVSGDGRALFTYVVPAEGVAPNPYGGRLLGAFDGTGVHLFGDAVVDHLVTQTSIREMLLLGLLALGVVLIIQTIITRSLAGGLILSTVSIVPGLWTLALFPTFNEPVGTTNLVVPVIVMVLATSYSIHLYRYWVHTGHVMEPALDRVSGVILAAGLTTIVGFLSLSVTPSEFLRDLGFFIVAGTIAALICSLVLLPPILHWWRGRGAGAAAFGGPAAPGAASRSGDPGRDDADHADLPPVDAAPLPAAPPTRLARLSLKHAPAHPVRTLVVFALLVVLFGAAVPLVRSRASYRDVFVHNHPVSQSVTYFQARTGTDHELSLTVETGEEYGLVNPDLFMQVKRFQEELPEVAPGSYAVSYVDLVEWLLGRLDGSLEPVTPQSDAEIGEALELLSGQRIGLSFESLVDRNWQAARLSLWVGVALRQERGGLGVRQGRSEAELVLDEIREHARGSVETAETELVGWPVLLLRRTVYMVQSQVLSLGLFALFLVGFLLFLFRSLPWALLAGIPTLVGVIVYFGLMGWLGILHDPMHVLMVCALLGVSNDDVLYFLIVYRRARVAHSYHRAIEQTYHYTGIAIVQTTLIIGAGVAVFYGSSVHYLGWAAMLLTFGLFAATATTLFVVPVILRWMTVRTRKGDTQ